MEMIVRLWLWVVISSIFSCKENTLPKPKAMLRLDYGAQNYKISDLACFYTFKKNERAHIETNPDCSMNINYPRMQASIYVTYKPIEKNLNRLLRDAQKFTYEHVTKADDISEQPYINHKANVFGMFYQVSGNAASPTQFYITDSVQHFLTGSVYFNSKPNYDSVYPAAKYLEEDVRVFMESITW